MLFVDYVFDVLPGGSIAFDKELKPSDLRTEEGEEFVVKIIEERVFLLKKED